MNGCVASALMLLVGLGRVGTNVARADDVALDVDASMQLYEVRGPRAPVVLSRRRLVHDVALWWSRALDAREGARVSAAVRLRLDQDFGESCHVAREACFRQADPRASASWVPLATDGELDAPELWVELRESRTASRLRVGRQSVLEPAGLTRIDGASVRVAPWRWLGASLWAGRVVRRATLGGSDAYEPRGALQLDLQGIDPSRVPWADRPVPARAAGAAMELSAGNRARVRIGLRDVREPDDLVERLAFGALRLLPLDGAGLDATGVLDVALEPRVVEAVAAAEVDFGTPLRLRAEAARHRPRFALGTIWAWFDLPARDELALGARLVRGDLDAGVHAGLRWWEHGGERVEPFGRASAWLRLRPWTLEARLEGWAAGTFVGGVEARRPLGSDVSVALHTSTVHHREARGAGRTSVSSATEVQVRLSEHAVVGATLEHAWGERAGHRLRGVVSLGVQVWR
ncbi:MAG: hypothetical protein NZ898_08665 [Myxococcota bacterium]|nr:hypothetical protein [Myxococcota bacterium]